MRKPVWELRPEEEDVPLFRYPKIVNLDDMFARSENARIVNSDALLAKSLADDTINTIYANCNGELGFVPTCECGATRGLTKEGTRCPICGTTCSTKFVNSLEHVAWLSIPTTIDGDPKKGFAPVIHPIWYLVLKKFTKAGRTNTYSLFDVLLNPALGTGRKKDITIPDDFVPYLKGRGFSYFYEHADEVLDMFMYEYPKTAKRKDIKALEKFRAQYRNMLFTTKIPILHNSLHVMTNNGNTLNYVDKASQMILSAAYDLSAETFKLRARGNTERRKNIALFNIYQSIIAYDTELLKEKIGTKTGLLRKQNFGSRLHWTGRCVVHAQNVAGPLDELVMPWVSMCIGWKLEIINLLVHRKKLTPNQALKLWYRSLSSFVPEVDEVLTTLIKEAPGGRLPIVMGRNPTIAYGSEILLFISRYKKDPTDCTMGVNACIVEPMNMGTL